MINWIIGGIILLYAGYSLLKFLKKSSKGQCATCSAASTCTGCCQENFSKLQAK